MTTAGRAWLGRLPNPRASLCSLAAAARRLFPQETSSVRDGPCSLHGSSFLLGSAVPSGAPPSVFRIPHGGPHAGMGLFRFLARVTIGLLFAGHGAQKLFGWFGGGGLDQTAAAFESMELRPGRRNALAAGLCETGGGLLFAAGAATPVAAAALSTSMITAIKTVHWKQ